MTLHLGHTPDDSAIKRRWRTPQALFDQLNHEYPCSLDAAAEHGAQLCERYITPTMDTLQTEWGPLVDVERPFVWYNPPWGAPHSKCSIGCKKKHVHHTEDFAGTSAFTRRAITQLFESSPIQGVIVLVNTAPDTSWWRSLFERSAEVRLLPRVRFIDPETGKPGPQPPGAGCTIFVLRRWCPLPAVTFLADEVGRRLK